MTRTRVDSIPRRAAVVAGLTVPHRTVALYRAGPAGKPMPRAAYRADTDAAVAPTQTNGEHRLRFPAWWSGAMLHFRARHGPPDLCTVEWRKALRDNVA
jgi:hypothetical protein